MNNNLAIIGVGPRGLCALEEVVKVFAKSKKELPFIQLFEEHKLLGAGQVWNENQSNLNWLNISQRALHNLKGREELTVSNTLIPSFPSYIDWIPKENKNQNKSDADLFPPRYLMGKYLHERYNSIANPMIKNGLCEIVQERINHLEYQNNSFELYSEKSGKKVFKEVLLTIGHQPTQDSKQIANWKKYVAETPNVTLFDKPYPIEQFINSSKINKDSTVAIRGFGLAMIDNLRALTMGKGGEFEITNNRTFESIFKTSDKVPKKIFPFSLDGNPMVPKPLNAEIDEYFTPDEKEMKTFKASISKYTNGLEFTESIDFLLNAVANIAARQYHKLAKKSVYFFEPIEAIEQVALEWLNDEYYEHPSLYPTTNEPAKTIETFLKMATDLEKVSLDYCIGQVWRHCQPAMYKLFSHAALSSKVMAMVVKLDERVKRYSYGPPVESMQQILALYKADIVSFDLANDPKISETGNGWKLSNKKDAINCEVILNSILDSPHLLKVNSSIIKKLLTNDIIEPIHSEFGIRTQSNGLVSRLNDKELLPLAFLGRLCQGSVLGVDAILECFNVRVENWAKGVLERAE